MDTLDPFALFKDAAYLPHHTSKKKIATILLAGAAVGTALSPLMIKGSVAHPDSLYAKLFK